MNHYDLLNRALTTLLVSIVLCGCTAVPSSRALPISTSASTVASECPIFVITGRITNIGQVRQFLSQASYLQLVSVPTYPAATRFTLTLDFFPDETAAFRSDLAQIPLPLDGVFRFQVSNLKPGSYFVAAQRTRNAKSANGYYTPMSLTINDSNLSIVPVIDGVHFACHWDLGNVVINGP